MNLGPRQDLRHRAELALHLAVLLELLRLGRKELREVRVRVRVRVRVGVGVRGRARANLQLTNHALGRVDGGVQRLGGGVPPVLVRVRGRGGVQRLRRCVPPG